jgi:hypothetical protein
MLCRGWKTNLDRALESELGRYWKIKSAEAGKSDLAEAEKPCVHAPGVNIT